MSKLMSLTKPEGTFTLDNREGTHFAFDCACGGRGASYGGTTLGWQEALQGYTPSNTSANGEHTYYTNRAVLRLALEDSHRESKGQSPLLVKCRGCKKDLPLTLESFQKLVAEIETTNSGK